MQTESAALPPRTAVAVPAKAKSVVESVAWRTDNRSNRTRVAQFLGGGPRREDQPKASERVRLRQRDFQDKWRSGNLPNSPLSHIAALVYEQHARDDNTQYAGIASTTSRRQGGVRGTIASVCCAWMAHRTKRLLRYFLVPHSKSLFSPAQSLDQSCLNQHSRGHLSPPKMLP